MKNKNSLREYIEIVDKNNQSNLLTEAQMIKLNEKKNQIISGFKTLIEHAEAAPIGEKYRKIYVSESKKGIKIVENNHLTEEQLNELWQGIKSAAKGIQAGLKGVGGVAGAAGQWAGGKVAKGAQAVGGAVAKGAQSVKGAVQQAGQAVAQKAQQAGQAISQKAQQVGQAASQAYQQAANPIHAQRFQGELQSLVAFVAKINSMAATKGDNLTVGEIKEILQSAQSAAGPGEPAAE